MTKSHRFLKKASTATLVMWMTVSILSPMVWADDATPTDTPAPDPTSTPAEIQVTDTPAPTTVPDPTSTPADPSPSPVEVSQPTDTPAPTAEPTPATTNTIDTGDASAAAQTNTAANTNADVIPGQVSQGTGDCAPQGETPCNGNVNVNNDNTATTSANLDATAASGTNDSTGASGSADITTGDASATGLMSTQANTNAVIMSSEETPTPTPTPTPDETKPDGLQCVPTPTPTPEETITPDATPSAEAKELNVSNTNVADIANNADVTAITGNNTATGNSGSVNIDTGNAESLVNVLNVINTNIVGSDVEVLTLNLTCTENTDIDLNAIWSQLLTVDENGNVILNSNLPQNPNLKITITNSNQATVTNNVNASADTGNNTASDSASASINTGNAAAAANVTNIVNTNILGTKYFIGIINILTSQKINLILPRPEYFDPASSALIFRIPVTNTNQNQANVQNDVNAAANTGENISLGNGQNTTSTGNAVAVANSTTLANLNIIGNSWFFLILNNAGGWTGNIVNWTTAGSVQKPDLGVNILQTGFNPSQETNNNNEQTQTAGLPVVFNNTNEANVTNNVNAIANTGGNVATNNTGGANITTGNAWAFANLFNLVNTNIMGSRWFMSAINILGNWSGDAIFAYPDVGINVSSDRQDVEPGDIINLDLHYENSGYDRAKGVSLNLDLPKEMSYVSDGGKLAGGCHNTSCSWEVGTLNARQSGDFPVSLRISDNFSFDNSQAFWDKLIPRAMADGDRKSREIPVNATVTMAEPDPNMQNNASSISEVVYEKGPNADNRQPQITVSAWNNVHGFVYPGDTISFEIKINNNTDTPLFNSQLVQELYGPSGEYLGNMLFPVKTIDPFKSGRLTFGLTVPLSAPAGQYHTEAYVTGQAANGNHITSSSAATLFAVKSRGSVAGVSTEPTQADAGQVLGNTAAQTQTTPAKNNIWNFVMLIAMSSVVSANQLEKRKRWQDTVKRLFMSE